MNEQQEDPLEKLFVSNELIRKLEKENAWNLLLAILRNHKRAIDALMKENESLKTAFEMLKEKKGESEES